MENDNQDPEEIVKTQIDFETEPKSKKMAPPAPESLAGMGLLSKWDSIFTEFVSLREDNRRKAYYDKFLRAYASVEELNNVKWCTDSTPTNVTNRCNGNIVLLEIGARVPASEDRLEYPVLLCTLKQP